MPENNSYFGHFERMASALERAAEGAAKPLKDRTFDFSTDDGQTAALAAVIRALGGEVTDA